MTVDVIFIRTIRTQFHSNSCSVIITVVIKNGALPCTGNFFHYTVDGFVFIVVIATRCQDYCSKHKCQNSCEPNVFFHWFIKAISIPKHDI